MPTTRKSAPWATAWAAPPSECTDTNNPGKRAGIEGYGLSIVERVPLEIQPNENNLNYLRTKKEKLGHVLHLMS